MYVDRSLLNGCHSVWQKLIDNPMMPSPFGHICKQIKFGAKHSRWLYLGNKKKKNPHSGGFLHGWKVEEDWGGGVLRETCGRVVASGAREHQIAVVTVGDRGQSEVFPRSRSF
jgi:hypothetical protein